MKKRIVLFLLLIPLCLMLSSSISFANTYSIWDDWGGTYADAEKSPTNTEDDLMCWAAAASNILEWSGWGDIIGDADSIFAYYQDHWTDEGGHAEFAWDWWFDGTNESQGRADWSQVDVAGGGFYTTYDFTDYYLRSGDDLYAMGNINFLLKNGYGTVIGVTDNIGAHAITCWGYEYDDNGYFQGIWVTDSDDQQGIDSPSDDLVYYDVTLNDYNWYLQDFYGYNTWYINDVQGLSSMPTVPEPATMLLFGLGILGIAGVSRKKTA